MPVVLRPTVGLPFLLLGLGVLMAVVVGSGLVFPGPSDAVPELSFSGIPLSFEPNVGQSDESVEFLARGDGYAVFLVDGGATVDMDDGDILRVRLVGSSGSPVAAPSDRLEGAGNYLIGSDSDRWLTGVPHYGRVLYNEVYPGIDLAYYGNRRQLEFDFMVGPAADPHAIRLDFDGAMSLDIDTAGNLIVHASESDFTLLAPFLYQDVDGVKLPVGGGYSLKGPTEVGFLVGAYDRSKTLVIDPVIEYSTYLGGTGLDQANGVAVDTAGNLYVTGNTSSVDFPTQGPLQPALDGTSDAFVLKLSEDGSTLLYSTYIGGRSGDSGIGIAVNTVGEAYVTGHTTSTDFPTAGPLQASNAGGLGDAFVLKLDSTGSALLYSTYLGGNQTDKGNAIAVDQSGNAYVTGFTNGPFPNTFPQVGGFQAGPGGGSFEAFVAKLDPAGSALVYSSFLGGGNTEEGRGIAVDSAGNTYVTGNTTSTNFPSVNAIQPAGSPGGKAFVTKINPAGSGLVFSTVYGGAPGTVGTDIALDTADDIYISGYSVFDGLGTAGSAQPVFGGVRDAFAAKFVSDGSAVVYSTYIGGTGFDEGWGITVDSSGSAYVAGLTESANLLIADPVQSVYAGSRDALVAKISPSGSSFVYSTFLGGDGIDAASAVAVGASSEAYIVGKTGFSDFPTVNALQPTNAGSDDAFITKLVEPEPIVTPIPGPSFWGLLALAAVAFVLLVLRPRRLYRPERWRRF